MRLTLSAHPPFSLSAVVSSHGWVRLAPFGTNTGSTGLTYVDRLDSGRVVEIVIQESAGGVSVEADDQLSEAEQNEVSQKATWLLGLDQDFSAFYAVAREEPKLAQVEKRAQGRLLRSPTLFEDTVKTMLTTNTRWAGTIRMVEALVTQFGEPLPVDTNRHAFPTAEQLAATDADTLRSAVRLGYRAPYVVELASAVVSGELDLESLKRTRIPTAELWKYLLTIKGVGGYAAATLLMILGRYGFVPLDSWALKKVSHAWYRRERVGQAEVEAAFQHWAQWKALAYWFWDWSYRGEG